jgi:hypothetical protein
VNRNPTVIPIQPSDWESILLSHERRYIAQISKEINKRFDELSLEAKATFELLDEKLDTKLGEVGDQYERRFSDLKIQ